MIGRAVLGTIGTSLSVFAKHRQLAKAGGITLDYGTVAVVNAGADVTWSDNFVVKAGWKALRYGQFIARITSGPTTGYFGPWDPAAADGRQLIKDGDFFFLAESIAQVDLSADNPPAYFGGDVYKLRMIAIDSGTPTLATGPLWSAVLPVLRQINLVTEDMVNP